MVDVNNAIIARLKKEGISFEILVDCDKAIEFRKGNLDSLNDVLATNDIFSDVKQGERASEEDIRKAFHTTNVKEIAETIIRKGEVQLTTEHKNKLRAEKKKQIANLIHRNAIDPKSGLPHPLARIESAMEEARVKVEEFKDAEEQVQDVISKLRTQIPLKIETRELEVQIPSQNAGSAYGTVKRKSKILREEWLDNGDLKLVLEIPAGVQEELENELSKLTKGNYELKILKKI
jgi:ribosome maturation protein SDO1